jgi:hypothetical protein
VTDLPEDDDQPEDNAGTDRVRARREARAASRGLLSLLPRGDLTKVALLLLFLAIIVVLQRRSGDIARRFSEGLMGTSPAQTQPRQPPHVRQAPPARAP